MSPVQRSLKLLKKEGGLSAVVEKWNPHVKRRQDLWGFGDLLHVNGNTVTIVQVTTGSNVAAHMTKIREIPAVRLWLNSPTRTLELHGWRKAGPRGKRKLWSCRRIQISLDDLEDIQPITDLCQQDTQQS